MPENTSPRENAVVALARRRKLNNTRHLCAAIALCAIFLLPQRSLCDTLQEFARVRDAFIDEYRRTGRQDPAILVQLEPRLAALANAQSGESRLRAMFELAQYQRLAQQFAQALVRYEATALEAERAQHRDIAFDAWIGLARTHTYNTRNHGAAERALDRALIAAGAAPTTQQLHDLSAYRTQILQARGELDGALVASLETLRRAEKPEDKFYAELDAADIMMDFARSCDYRKLVDAKTQNDAAADGWGACRRALTAANEGYARAIKSAQSLGWMALAGQAAEFQRMLGVRRLLIDSRANAERIRSAGVFAPHSVKDVLVNRNFAPAALSQSEASTIGALIDQAVTAGDDGPRSLYLRGVEAQIKNDSATALKLFRQAAAGLTNERQGLFDPQHRGAVIENRVEIMRDLALALLAAGQDEAAFDVFESFRSRGLNELVAAFERRDLTAQDREWLSNLIEVEARTGAHQVRVRERAIAGADYQLTDGELEESLESGRKRRALFSDVQRKNKFASASFEPAHLKTLQEAVSRAEVPVLLYWTTPTNVVVWVVAPGGRSEVRSVFLPDTVLEDRVQRVVSSVRAQDGGRADDHAAEQLYLYLIAPFEQWLSGQSFMIVPQGALLDLPFESLIDPRTQQRVVERWATSYAPNATFATRILSSHRPIGKSLRAVVDQTIPTQEAERIASVKELKVEIVPSHKIDPTDIAQWVGNADVVHVLAHGAADGADPLLSSLRMTAQQHVDAARVLAGPWQNVQLAVLSSCDSGAWTRRISNEIYGFPWALMAAGVDNAIVSRWRVDGPSNADWMASFYSELGKGASPAVAAAHASRSMIASGRQHPFYWAAMRVIGR